MSGEPQTKAGRALLTGEATRQLFHPIDGRRDALTVRILAIEAEAHAAGLAQGRAEGLDVERLELAYANAEATGRQWRHRGEPFWQTFAREYAALAATPTPAAEPEARPMTHESNHHGWGGPCKTCAPCPHHGADCPKDRDRSTPSVEQRCTCGVNSDDPRYAKGHAKWCPARSTPSVDGLAGLTTPASSTLPWSIETQRVIQDRIRALAAPPTPAAEPQRSVDGIAAKVIAKHSSANTSGRVGEPFVSGASVPMWPNAICGRCNNVINGETQAGHEPGCHVADR